MREKSGLFSAEQLTSKPKPSSTPFQAYVAATWPDVKHADELEHALADAFPKLDLLQQAKEARLWELANPNRRKQRHAVFLTNWMRNAERYRARDQQALPQRREFRGLDRDGRPVFA